LGDLDIDGRIKLEVKVKVKLSLCLTKHHAMKAYWEWRYSSTHSLTRALDGSEWSALRPGRFTPRERAPGTHCTGGWVGPRAVLDTVVKRKIPTRIEPYNPDRPTRSPALYRLSYHGSSDKTGTDLKQGGRVWIDSPAQDRDQ
jgi:hypothetical protein